MNMKRFTQDNKGVLIENKRGWLMPYADHLDDKKADKDKLIEALAIIYNNDSTQSPFLAVAFVCDDFLDKPGALLGEVRDKAMELSQEPSKG